MVSSWAGAMGQTQFMPSNFVDYAIDFSGDGRIDIWSNVPDVLGFNGELSAKWKWNSALPWGFEVTVPGELRLYAQPRNFRGMGGPRCAPR